MGEPPIVKPHFVKSIGGSVEIDLLKLKETLCCKLYSIYPSGEMFNQRVVSVVTLNCL